MTVYYVQRVALHFYINKMKKLLALSLLCIMATSLNVSITFSNTTVSAISSYQVVVQRTNTSLLSNSTIVFTFDSGSYDASQLSNVTCSPVCTKSNLSLLFFASLFVSSPTLFKISIGNVTNPPSTKAPGYSYKLLDGSNNTLESNLILPSSFIAGTFKSCLISFAPTTVNSNSTASLSITPGSPTPVGGYLLVRFPSQWANTIDNTTVLMANLSCSSPSAALSNAGCSVLLTGMVTVNSFAVKTTSSYVISMSPIITPPTVLPESTVYVSSFDSEMYSVDSETVCTMAALTPNSLSVSNTTNATVSANFTPVLKFTTTDKIAIGDVLKIAVMNTGVGVGDISILSVKMTDLFGAVSSVQIGMSSAQTDQTQRIYGYVLPRIGNTAPISKGVEMQLSGLTFTSSPTAEQISAFSVALYRNNSMFCTGTSSLTPQPGLLRNISITAINPLVSASTSYNITFTLSSGLTSVGYVQVLLPYGLTTSNYTNQNCSSTIGTNSTNAICSLSNGTVKITNLFTGIVAANTTVSVRFSGVTNPVSERPTSVFTIYTYYTNSTGITDQGTAVFAATSDTITNCTVTRSFDTVGQASVYTFVYITKNTLPAGANIVISTPSDIFTYANTTVTISQNNSVALSKNPTISPQLINITSPYLTVISPGTILKIIINTLSNPNTTKQPASFGVSSYDANYLVEKTTMGVIIGPATVGGFLQKAIAQSNTINGQSANYTLTFQTSINYQSSTVLRLSIPSEIGFPSAKNLSCLPIQGFVNSTTMNNSVNGTSLLIFIPQPLNTSTTYKIVINNLTNPRTFSQSSSFSLLSLLPDLVSSIDSATISGVSNTLANNILNLTMAVMSPSQSYLNSNQTLRFNITTKNALVATDYIELTYPKEYTHTGSSNSSVCVQPTYSCIPDPNNLLKIKITSASFNNTKTLVLQIVGYLSPNSTTSITYFTVNTFDSSRNSIDQINTSNANTQILFTATCQGSCQTCNSSNLTFCLTCYKSPISSFVYLVNGSCLSVCPDGFYGNTTSQLCVACVSPCRTCIDSIQCLSCINNQTNANKSFDSSSKKCLDTCPNGTFSSLSSGLYVCASCGSTCLTCSNLSTNCTSCSSVYLLYNFSCVLSCPNGTFGVSNLCQNCDKSCSTCEVNATTCIACATNYYWSATTPKACTNDCGTMVASKGRCQCDSKCLSCSMLIENCTSCNTNVALYANYFFNNSVGQCLQFCPSGSYLLNQTCVLCPLGCRDCRNSSYCLSCIGIYSLLNNTCVKECGEGLFSLANICEMCASSCRTCVDVSQKCTSCTSPMMLQQLQCVSNCTLGIPITTNSSIVCTLCNPSCQTCLGAIDNCTSCSSGKYLLMNKCYVTCPNTTFPNETTCSACSFPCQTCNLSALQCTSCRDGLLLQLNDCVKSCSDGYYKYQQTCVTQCPNKTIRLNSQCVDVVDTVNKNQRIVPVPFTIAAVVTGIVVIIARAVSKETSVPTMAVSIVSLLEILCWFVSIALAGGSVKSTQIQQGIICLAVAIGLHLLINIIAYVMFFKLIKSDEAFKKWYNRFATIYVKTPLYLLSCLNHKFFNMIFSKAFGSSHLSAALSSPTLFSPLLICTGISFLPQILAITASSLFLVASAPISQLSMISIDCLVLTSLTTVFSAWSIYKPAGFFEQINKYTANEEINYQSQYNQTMEDINIHEGEVGVGCVPIRIDIPDHVAAGIGEAVEVDHIENEPQATHNKILNQPNDHGSPQGDGSWESQEEVGQAAAPPIQSVIENHQIIDTQEHKQAQEVLQNTQTVIEVSQIRSVKGLPNTLKAKSNKSPQKYKEVDSAQQSIVNQILTKSCVKEFDNLSQHSAVKGKTEFIDSRRDASKSQSKSPSKSPSKSSKIQFSRKQQEEKAVNFVKDEKASQQQILGQSLEKTGEQMEFTSPFQTGPTPDQHIEENSRADYVEEMMAMPSFRTTELGRLTRTSEHIGHIVRNSQIDNPIHEEKLKQLDKTQKIPEKPHYTSRSSEKIQILERRNKNREKSPTQQSQDFWKCDNWGIFLGPLSPKRRQTDIEPEHPFTSALSHIQGLNVEQSKEQNPIKLYTEEDDILSHINYEKMVINDRRRQSYNHQKSPIIDELGRNQTSSRTKALERIYLQRASSKRRNLSHQKSRLDL